MMNNNQLQSEQQSVGMGWLNDEPDSRDKTSYIKISTDLPASVDLREWCSPVAHQGKLNSCTAHAAIALVEYFQKRSFGKYLNASRLFLYKVTRNLLPVTLPRTGNVPTFSRTTMKALAIFGVPPEESWPYDEAKLDEEPSAFCYAYAGRYRTINYYRIDIKDRTREIVLQQIKASLAAFRPVMFGLILYPNCKEQSFTTGRIPIPTDTEVQWIGSKFKQFGHNLAAVGYDDRIKIKNTDSTGIETTGAFLVKNSWGEIWGEGGYGWLPYEYVLKTLSMDWWTIMKHDWLDTGEFEPQK